MPNTSNYSKFYTSRKTQWEKVRHVLEGEDAVKEMGVRYLPKPSGMTQNDYRAYKERACFFGVAERTQRQMTGMIMRKDPIFKVPDKLKPMLLEFTNEGQDHLTTLDEIMREELTIGRFGMLLNHYENAGPLDVPHINTYYAEDITDWTYQWQGGRKVLVRVVLRDTLDNDYNMATQEMLELTLENGVYTAYRLQWNDATNDHIRSAPFVPFVQGKPLDHIPFWFINPYDMRAEIEKPPFLDLANMNIAHYRNSADYEQALFMTAQPTPWVAGVSSEQDKPKTIGPSVIWYLQTEGRAGYLDFEGKGIESQQRAMKDKEDRMAALGARMIAENAVRNETVDTARLRGRGEMSLLQSVVLSGNLAFTRILREAAVWVGANPDEVEIGINSDFVETRMTHQELTALVQAWQGQAISRKTLHENLQRGEIIDVMRTPEEEETDIKNDPMTMPLNVPEPTAPVSGA
jgi:hypothetical protein